MKDTIVLVVLAMLALSTFKTDADVLEPTAILWCAQSGTSYIRGIDDTIGNWFSPTRAYLKSKTTTAFSYRHFDVDYIGQSLVWTQGSNTIASQPISALFNDNSPSSSLSTIYVDTSVAITDIASDWYSGNVYFVDATNKFIGLAAASLTNTAPNDYIYNVVVRKAIYNPTSIVLDPDVGLMFWLDMGASGKTPMIQRATLQGTRQTVISQSLHFLVNPLELAIDRDDRRIYWLTGGSTTQSLVSCDYDGLNESHVTFTPPTTYSAFTIYQNYVLLADNIDYLFHVFYKNATYLNTVPVDANIFDIKVYGDGASNTNHTCQILGCSELCINLGQGQGQCACTEGHMLLPDGKTCVPIGDTGVLYSTGSNIFLAHLTIFPKNNSLDIDVTQLPLTFDQADTVACNYDQGLLYVADGSSKNIIVAALTPSGTGSTSEITVNTGSVRGMTIDTATNNIIWTDAARNTITMATAEGRYPRVISQTSNPGSITMDPTFGALYWTDGKSVFTSSLLGDIPMPVSGGEKGIEGIAVDPGPTKRLAWAVNDPWIDVYTRDSGIQQYSTADMTSLHAVTLFGDVVIWGQSNSSLQFLRMTDNGTFSSIRVTPPTLDTPSIQAVTLYSNYLQPNISGPCTLANGGCSQLCLQIASKSRVCVCGVGFTLASDGISCVSNLKIGYFLLLVDPYQKQIYQLSTNGSAPVQGVPVTPTSQPISVDYDVTSRTLYWIQQSQDSVQIWSSDLNYNYPTLIFDGTNVSTPYRLAVDGTHDLLFFLDTTQESVVSMLTNGTELHTLVSRVIGVRALALDIANRIVYFTNATSLWSCNYDGTNIKQLVNTFTDAGALAVGTNGTVYVGDKTQQVLVAINTQTLHTVNILTPGEWQVVGVAVDKHYVYFTTWDQRTVFRLPLDNSTNAQPQKFSSEVFARVTDLKYIDFSQDLPPPIAVPNTDNGINLLALILGICLPCLLVLLIFLLCLLCLCRRRRCKLCHQHHKGACNVEQAPMEAKDTGKINPIYGGYFPELSLASDDPKQRVTSPAVQDEPSPDYDALPPSIPPKKQLSRDDSNRDEGIVADGSEAGENESKSGETESVYDPPLPPDPEPAPKPEVPQTTESTAALTLSSVFASATPSTTPNEWPAFDAYAGLRHGGGREREGVVLRHVVAPPPPAPSPPESPNEASQEYVNKGYVFEMAKRQKRTQSLLIDYSVKPKPYRQATGFAPASRVTPTGVIVQTFGRKSQVKYGSHEGLSTAPSGDPDGGDTGLL